MNGESLVLLGDKSYLMFSYPIRVLRYWLRFIREVKVRLVYTDGCGKVLRLASNQPQSVSWEKKLAGCGDGKSCLCTPNNHTRPFPGPLGYYNRRRFWLGISKHY